MPNGRVLERLLRLPTAIDRLVADAEAEDLADRQRRRTEAFAELAKIDKSYAREFAKIDAELDQARTEELTARTTWEAARRRLSAAECERNICGMRLDARRAGLLADIRGHVPGEITRFVNWIESELGNLPREAAVDKEFRELPPVGMRRGPTVVDFVSNSRSLAERADALVAARRAAMELVEQNLDSEQLTKAIDGLRRSIPSLKMEPIKLRMGDVQ